MQSAVITPGQGEYQVLQVSFPGQSPENIGVLLRDLQTDQIALKFRRDWKELTADPEDLEYLEALPQFLSDLQNHLGISLLDWLEEHPSNFIQVTDRERVLTNRLDATLRRLYDRHIAPKVLPFRTHLPLYSASAAAGGFSSEMSVESEGWVEAPEGLRLTPDMFVAHVNGRSMEPRIPDGSLCILRGGAALAGSRQGKLVLVENQQDIGQRYTIKRYRSTNMQTGEGWERMKITLEPLNPEFEPWELEEGSPYIVRGIYDRILEQ